jgi:hypothetical protein
MTSFRRCFRHSMTHFRHKSLVIKDKLFIYCLFNDAVSSDDWEEDYYIMNFERIFNDIKNFLNANLMFVYKSKEISSD